MDGGAALVLAHGDSEVARSRTPLGRIVSWATAGVPPEVMGLGPVPASRAALRAAGLRLEDMARIEVNEAFAPQYLAVERELRLDRARVNVNGGAIALGHPLGATGTRLLLTLLLSLGPLGRRLRPRHRLHRGRPGHSDDRRGVRERGRRVSVRCRGPGDPGRPALLAGHRGSAEGPQRAEPRGARRPRRNLRGFGQRPCGPGDRPHRGRRAGFRRWGGTSPSCGT